MLPDGMLLNVPPTRDALEAARAFVRGDQPWQAELRLRQSLWREGLGVPPGVHRGRPLGSLLPAGDRHSNFLTPEAAAAVKVARAQPGALVSAPRVYENLLSSQPLAFNLFAPVGIDPALRSFVGRALWPDLLHETEAVLFEWSPGRGDARFLANRSAFDVALLGRDEKGRRTCVGIEVKYHEDMTQDPGSPENPRYGEVARGSGAFADTEAIALRSQPLKQLWFDHLLALSMLGVAVDRAKFVLLAPDSNPAATAVDVLYRSHLIDSPTYERRSLEEVAGVVRRVGGPGWPDDFMRRYLTPTERQ